MAEDVLFEQSLLELRNQRICLPWERGIHGLVFGSRTPRESILPLPVLSHPSPLDSKPDLSTLPTATQAFAVQRARLAKLVKSDDAIRFEALRKVKVMTLYDPDASVLGRSLSAEAALLSDDKAMFKSFEDTFAPKATSTLVKRAASMWRFFEFCVENGFGSPLKAREREVYAYVQHLKEDGAPTSGQAFLESWTFFSVNLGFRRRPEESPMSGRIKGAVSMLLGQKRKLIQAAPLTVQMIKALERIVLKPPLAHWRVIAGHILFCMGSSARFSDTIHLESLVCQQEQGVSLLEAASTSYKTGTGEKKSVLLPLLSLGRFILDEAWGPVWVQRILAILVGSSHDHK